MESTWQESRPRSPAPFLVHTHTIPPPMRGQPLAGAAVAVEMHAHRLHNYYGWRGPNLTIDDFFEYWPTFKRTLGIPRATSTPLTLEGSQHIQGVDALPALYRSGLRVIQIRHWRDNRYIAAGRITAPGWELLAMLHSLGLVLDVSHMGMGALAEVLDGFEGSIIASHVVLADLLHDHKSRSNVLTEDMIRRLGGRGALIGVPFVNDLVAPGGVNASGACGASICDVAEQITAIAAIAGVESVGLGPDYFDYEAYSDVLGKHVDVVEDLDTTDGFGQLAALLVEVGHTESDVFRIFAGNAVAFFSADANGTAVRGDSGCEAERDNSDLIVWNFTEGAAERSRAEAMRAQPRATSPPRSAWLALSNYCNLSCLHCRRRYGSLGPDTQRRDIGDALYHRVTDELLPSLSSLILGGNNYSEVTQASRFPEIVRLLARKHERDISVSVQTNGSLIAPATLEELLALDAVINISVEGGTEKTTRMVRGLPLDQIGAMIGRIAGARRKLCSLARIVLSFTAWRSNIDELLDLVEFAERNGADEVNVMYMLPPTPGWNKQSAVHHVDHFNRVTAEATELCRGWRVSLMAPQIRERADEVCARPWYTMSVNANGEVRTCCLLGSPVIGNLNDSSVADIWNGVQAEALRLSVNGECPEGDCGACVLRNLPFVSLDALRNQLAFSTSDGEVRRGAGKSSED